MVVGTERPFSLYGVLNLTTDTQFVLIFPIHARMDSLPSEVLDARFTSVDLQTGEERLWADSVFRNHLGLNRHVYWSAFSPEYDHTYRLEVVDPAGVSSRLDVSVEQTFDFGAVDLSLLGSLINTYDRRNIFYVDLFTLQWVDQLPFIPSFGLKVALN